MPIYEYKCNECGEKFEVFVFTHADTNISCEECGSGNTERVLSSFASSGSSCRSNSGFR